MPVHLLYSWPGALTLWRISWSGRLNLLASSAVLLSVSFLPFTFAQSPPSCSFAECARADRTADGNSYPRARLPAKYDVSRIGQRGIGRGLNFYSYEREKQLGDEIAKRMEPSLTIIDDPFIDGYLNRIAQAIVAHSEASYNVRIKLLYDNFEINARSLPGGHLYMTTSLFLSLQNESEMAMIVAHEIAHVAARHDTRGFTRETLWDLPFFPLLRLRGPIGYSAQQVTSVLHSLPVLKFNRDTEREADLLGLEYAYSAGYDPQGILDFYERLALEESWSPGLMARLFDTHPTMKDRLRHARAEILALLPARDQSVLDTSEFQEAKRRLLTIVIEKQRAELAETCETGPCDGGNVERRHDTEPSDTTK